MGKSIGSEEKVNLKVTINLDYGTSITGNVEVPLEEVVKDIASVHCAYLIVSSNYNKKISYSLKEIAKGAIDVFKKRTFEDKPHEEQIKVYQTLVDYLENLEKEK